MAQPADVIDDSGPTAAGRDLAIGPRLRLSSLGFPKPGGARDREIDALKGWAILLVVLGHCLELADAGVFVPNASLRHHLFTMIYAFHMPLFMFLSGYVASQRTVRLQRSFVRLIVPFFSWLFVTFLITVHAWTRLGDYMWKGTYWMENALWFLWALFLCYLLLWPVQWAGKKWKYGEEAGFVVMFLLVNAVQVHYFFGIRNYSFGIVQVQYFFAFFAIGYLVKKHWNLIERIAKNLKTGILATSCVAYVALFFLTYYSLRDVMIPLSLADLYRTPLIYLDRMALPLLGILASFALVKAVRALKQEWLIAAFAWLGLATLDIYASHGLLIHVSFGTGWMKVISGFFAAFILGLALTYIVLRNWRPTSYVFLGRSYKNGPRYRLWLAPRSSLETAVELSPADNTAADT
jgi:fucose 4-O-acetylase-like acetyltransferase